MREINRIIVHCSATPPSMDIGADEIRDWHTKPRPGGRGWRDIGYHFVIRRDGTREPGRDLDKDGDIFEEVGAHARGHNTDSIGICLVGGIDGAGKSEANFTFMQYITLSTIISEIRNFHGDIEVLGHRDLEGVNKDCPCFNVKAFMEH